MARRDNLHIASTLSGRPPRLPYRDLKDCILGGAYELSIIFVGDRRSRTLNRRLRGKNSVANVLALPLTAAQGEVYVNPRAAARQAAKFNMTPTQFVAYLLIHGMLHLKGHRHGSTMDSMEQRWCTRFNVPSPS